MHIPYRCDRIVTNRSRDARNLRARRSLAWRCATVWEYESTDPARLGQRLRQFLG